MEIVETENLKDYLWRALWAGLSAASPRNHWRGLQPPPGLLRAFRSYPSPSVQYIDHLKLSVKK